MCNLDFPESPPKASQSSDSVDGESTEMEEETDVYDCVICGQSTPSTAEKTIGLVVFLQASSGMLGYVVLCHIKHLVPG